MLDHDVLLTIPTESLVVRVVLGSVVALVLARVLLSAGLRLPRVRAAAALVPTTALLAVVALSWQQIDLPTLWVSGEWANGLPIPVRDSFVSFAPAAWPLLVAGWALIAALRVGLRLWRTRRTRRSVRQFFRDGASPDERLAGAVARLAEQLRVAPPPVAMVETLPGGATVIGVRRPVLVVDRQLAVQVDDEELDGLVAHELAHVRRRDNLVSVLVGVARDLAFFVPGGRWALRRLHAEREAAADQLAVGATGRPGALASGLLKVLEQGGQQHECAAFAPSGSLESRVRRLCDERPSPGRLRRVAEAGVVLTTIAGSVVAAVELPALVAQSSPADAPQRDALAISWTHHEETPAVAEPEPAAAAFAVYRDNRNRFGEEKPPARSRTVVDDGRELNPAVLHYDADLGQSPAEMVGYSPYSDRGLRLRPGPRLEYNEDLVAKWRVTPVVRSEEGLSVWWMGRTGDQRR